MTLVPEDRTELTDEALRLIGVIAVESARLEWGLAGLLSTVSDVSHKQALKVPNKEKVRQILERVALRPSWLGEGVTADVARWTKRAGELLKQRGDLMHSTWIVGAEGEPHLVSHLRSGNRTGIDLDRLAELARDVWGHAAMGPGMWLAAMSDPFDLDDNTP